MSRRETFEATGFVVLRGFCKAYEREALGVELSHIINTQIDALPPEHVFFEDKSDGASLKQLQQLQEKKGII